MSTEWGLVGAARYRPGKEQGNQTRRGAEPENQTRRETEKENQTDPCLPRNQ